MTPHHSLEQKAQRVQRKVLRAHCEYHFSLLFSHFSFLSFESKFRTSVHNHCCLCCLWLLWTSGCMCCVPRLHKCGVWTPIHTKSQAASFRKVNILQSIVWSYFAVSHAASFSCFVWLWGSLAGAQSVSWILIDSIKLTSFGLENLKQSGQIWKWAKLPCMARQNVLLGQKCKRGFTVSNVVKSRAIICLWICVSINSTL